MTQEDKAKRYDEVLKRAKQLLETSVAYDRFTIEKIFPELKESEDEQIRKELLEHCINRRDGKQVCVDANDYRRWADWLEKQSEQKPQGKTALEAIKKEYNTIDPHPFKAEHFYVSKVDGKIHDMTYNPADMVEPKFKNGQWVVWQDKCYKVNYNGCGYELVDQNGLNTSLEYGTIDENAHFWTIQDAKDGDVLCCESGWTCIFKALNNHTNTFSSYCFMDSDKWFCNSGSECHTLDKAFIKAYNREIHPATKEQHDLLFQKMKEAGYEWDADKKELKKIEQKPVIKMKTPEESLGVSSNEYNKIVDECIYGDDDNKPAWSEEDEHWGHKAIYFMKHPDLIKVTPTLVKHTIDWLKSLKERMKGK